MLNIQEQVGRAFRWMWLYEQILWRRETAKLEMLEEFHLGPFSCFRQEDKNRTIMRFIKQSFEYS